MDRLYVSRIKRRRGLIGLKMRVNSFGWYDKHHIELLIVPVRINNTVPSENSTQAKEFEQQQKGKD